uniref:Uncharacterized protein n=1 Tax=Heterorhabditis bacteriophora TaxID=37862 RepID=A0A1I7WP24_HETBA
MESIRAYGAGLATGQFDSSTFFKKPTVIFRTIALVKCNFHFILIEYSTEFIDAYCAIRRCL